MKCYSISYDLRRPGQQYHSLHNALRTFGRYSRPTESHWLVMSNFSEREIYDFLKPHLDSSDRIFIASIDLAAAWWFLDNVIAEWVKLQLALTV